MPRLALFALSLLVPLSVVSFAACSSDDDASLPPSGADGASEASNVDATPPPTEQSSCVAYITAFCERSASCRPLGGGSLKSCLESTALCPEYFFAPGTARTIEGMLECAEAFKNLSCHEFLSGYRPACATAGLLGEGEPCISPAQCQNGSCLGLSPGLTCGVCGRLYGADEPCDGDGQSGPVACGIGRWCHPETRRCATIPAGAPLGSTCAPDTVCAADLCAATGGDAGTCERTPEAGAACVRPLSGGPAYCATGAFCKYADPERSSGTCAALAKVNEPCGTPLGAAYDIPCKESYCALAVGSAEGTCAPFVTIGSPCSDVSACGQAAYCHFTAPGQGTCRALAQPGEVCGPTSTNGASFVIPCASQECSTSDGGISVCLRERVARNGDCTAPDSECYRVLRCTDGKCSAVEYASCEAPDAGPDASDAGTD